MAAQRALLPILLSEPDASLARRVARGDDAAFEVLVDRHGEALGAFCRALLRNAEDAEDALQATLLRAYRAFGRAERPRAVRPWLLAIARNECLRVAGARPATEPLGAEPLVEARLPERMEARDRLRVLGGDLRALPERQRAAIVLREICGLSYRQAADVIGVTPEAVRHLVHDARLTLERFGAGREMDCAEVRRRIAAGDGRVLRARAVGAHLRFCADCRGLRARSRRPLAALLPPLPAALAGRWLGAKVAAGTIASAVVVSGVLVVGGADRPGRDRAEAAPARSAAVAPAPAVPAAAIRDVSARRSTPASSAPASGAPVQGDVPATAAPGGSAPAVAPVAAPAPAPDPAPAGPTTPGPAPTQAAEAPASAPPAPPAAAPAPAPVPASGPAPVVAVDVATTPVAATVSAGTGGVSAGARVAVPVAVPLPAVTVSAQVDLDLAPEPGQAPVRATVAPGLGLPALRVALP